MQDLIQENPGITRTEPMEVDSQEVAPASGLPNLPMDMDLVYRYKGTHPKREGGPVLLLQNYPHPLSLRGRGPYHFPTLLNT